MIKLFSKSYGFNKRSKTKSFMLFLKVIDTYNIKRFLLIFLLSFFFIGVLLLVTELTVHYKILIEKSNAANAIQMKILFFASRLLWDMKLAIPYAFLFTSAFFVYLMLSKNELLAMMSSGVSYIRINMPFYLFSAICCGILLAVGQNFLPNAIYKSEQTFGDLFFKNYTRAKYKDSFIFVSSDDKRTWKITSVVSESLFANISITKSDPSGQPEIELSAKGARYSYLAGWEFIDCKVSIFKSHSIPGFSFNKPAETFNLKSLNRSSDLYRKIFGYSPETPKDILVFGRDPTTMTTQEIIRSAARRDQSASYINSMNMELYTRFFDPFLCIFYALVGGNFIYRTYRSRIIITVLLAIISTLLCYFLSESCRFLVYKQIIAPIDYCLAVSSFFIILLFVLNFQYIDFSKIKRGRGRSSS